MGLFQHRRTYTKCQNAWQRHNQINKTSYSHEHYKIKLLISKANSVLQPWDTVCIREGTYEEIINPSNSGAPGRKITYTNYQDEEVSIVGKPGKLAVIYIGWRSSKSYIVIDGFNIRGKYFAGRVPGLGYPTNIYLFTVQVLTTMR